MVSAVTNIAVSGLQAAGRRLENSANNIANQSSTLSEQNGVVTQQAFQPKDIVQISEEAGGVRTEAVTRDPATVSIPDASNAAANENGITQYPNVDQTEELVKQQIATYDFKANLTVLKAQDKIEKSLIDIIA